jgi:hypothetical protein
MFFHLMKCGGTTLRHLLANEYPREQILPVPISPQSKAKPPYPYVHWDAIQYMLSLTPEAIAPYRLVMSHYDRRLARIANEEWRFMTVLRHPVRQLLSRYYFIDTARDGHGDEWERTCTQGFHHWLVHHSSTYANIQTRLLGLGDVQLALELLHDERMVFGLLEHFPESVRRFNAAFGWSLPTPPRYNKAVVDTDVIRLTQETYELAEQVQHQDMLLYKVAAQKFHELAAASDK